MLRILLNLFSNNLQIWRKGFYFFYFFFPWHNDLLFCKCWFQSDIVKLIFGENYVKAAAAANTAKVKWVANLTRCHFKLALTLSVNSALNDSPFQSIQMILKNLHWFKNTLCLTRGSYDNTKQNRAPFSHLAIHLQGCMTPTHTLGQEISTFHSFSCVTL